MRFEKFEKFLLTVCAVSILATVGYFVKDGFKTYPTFTKSSDDHNMITLKISGEVENPGTYRMPENSRACDLIYASGGITNNADIDMVDLDAVLTDGTTVNVPKLCDESFDGVAVVNINTADVSELMLVPGIGELLALRIVEHRTEYGPFADITDITKVRGLGGKKFDEIRDYIKMEG